MAAELRALAADGSYDEILPDWSDLTFSQDLLAAGSLTFSYPTKDGRHLDKLDYGNQVAILLDGVEPINGRFTLDEGQGSRIVDSDGSTANWAAKSNLSRLDKLMLAPGFGSVNVTPADTVFSSRTAGWLVANAVNNGILRGNSLPGVTANWLTWPLTGFTTTADSSGASWVDTYNVTFDPAVTATDVIAWTVENGLAEPMMDKKVLRLYRPDHNGRDLSVVANPVVLQIGRDFTEAGYEASSADLINSVLVLGDGTTCAWVKRQTSINTYGYREGSFAASGISTGTQLTNIGETYLDLHAVPRQAYTYQVAAMYLEKSYGVPRPFIDYQVGDTVLILDGVETAARRIRLLSATWPDGKAASVAITVSDWFGDREEDFDRRLKRGGL